MESRQHVRLSIECPVQYSSAGDHLQGEGTTLNLSTGGWKVHGSQPVQPGMPLFLRVSLPDGVEPMEVELAVVRWSHGQTFGVKNTILGEKEGKRLRRFVVNHVKQSDPSTVRSA